MIYTIFLCIANAGCHIFGAPVYTYTFDSPEACLAKLPVVMVRGKSVSSDGRLHVSKIEWLECDGKQTWQTVRPAVAALPDTSGAVDFKREPFVLMHCVGSECTKSSVISVSKKACEFSITLLAQSDATGTYACVKP